MNEDKGGTPLKPYEVGQKVWNRVIEKVCTVKTANSETRRHPRGEDVVTFYTYTLEEVGAIWQHHQLALKDPAAAMFQPGDEVPLDPAIEKAFARARELFHSPETENTALALGVLQTVYLMIKEELNAKV